MKMQTPGSHSRLSESGPLGGGARALLQSPEARLTTT